MKNAEGNVKTKAALNGSKRFLQSPLLAKRDINSKNWDQIKRRQYCPIQTKSLGSLGNRPVYESIR